MSFTIGLSVENAERVKASLGAVRTRIIPTMIKTARRGVWLYVVPPVRTLVAHNSGIGQRIWGRDQSGIEKQGLVKQGKLVIGSEGGLTPLLLRGIPSLLEDGGQIKPHTIRRGFGRKGKPMFHPGMTLRAHRFGRDSMEKAMNPIQRDVDQALAEMLRRNGF